MTLVKDIYDYIGELAPFETQADFDNSGLLLGNENAQVTKVLLALDITSSVIDEAKNKNCELIISHHPIIFSPLKSIMEDSLVCKMIKAGLSALCVHTNLDKAENIGVNVCLAKALKLKKTRLFAEEYLCIGELEEAMSDDEFAIFVKDSLNLKGVRYTKRIDSIKTVAVSSGAGGNAVDLQDKYNFDALVTGELKHHQFLQSVKSSLCAIEAGHFGSEDIVITPLLNTLKSKFNDVVFTKSQTLDDVVNFV